MIAKLKSNLIEGPIDIFAKGQKNCQQTGEKIDEFYSQVGKLQVERNFLSKKLSH